MPRTNISRYSDPRRATRTRQETARLIGCGVPAVDELIRKGRLTAVEVGVRLLPTVVSIENLLGRPIIELEAGTWPTESGAAAEMKSAP
jgi:hypothetical protein